MSNLGTGPAGGGDPRPSVWGGAGLLGGIMSTTSRGHLALLKQGFIFVLVLVAAVLSAAIPWLIVSNPRTMWAGVAFALLGTGFAGVASWKPGLLRWEIVIPAADFIAVGLLRYGTGDGRSVFLPIILLAIVWIAVWPGRISVLWLLIGASVTLLLPFALDPTGRERSEFVRLAFALTIYGTIGLAINELARQAREKLDLSQEQRRVIELELGRAATVQQSLLPPDSTILPNTFTVHGACVPARTVGGDFYDWYRTPDGIALTVGDVMGKGVGAGMIAAAVRSVIRSSIDNPDPAAAFERASVGTSTSDIGPDIQFTTCFHARIDPTGMIRWADAGHGLAIIRRADGTIDHLRSADLPVGVGTQWTTATVQAQPGDILVCVSDGVLDLFEDELNALRHLDAMLTEMNDPAVIVQRIVTLAGEEDRPDDVTVVAASFAPSLSRA